MNKWRQLLFFFIGCIFLLMIVVMIGAPDAALEAALKGMSIWWDVLFPSLLPFLVLAEMLLGLGVVHGIGTLLDPIMRPVFRVSGKGGFVMSMGFASGYPVGARLASQLWLNGEIKQSEGERLAAFSSTSDPIFLIGAVAVSFFSMPELAPILALAHYGGAIGVGLFLRGFSDKEPSSTVSSTRNRHPINHKHVSIWRRAFDAMHQARLQDNRPIGKIFEDAIHSSIRIIFMIGGLVVFFSVILKILSIIHIMNALLLITSGLFTLLQLPEQLAPALINGVFEVTLGAKTASQTPQVPLMFKTALAAFVLSWAGLSVHAQIMSIVQKTPFRYLPFLFARFMHGVLAFLITITFWTPMQSVSHWMFRTIPVMKELQIIENFSVWNYFKETLWFSALLFGFVIFVTLILSICITTFRRLFRKSDC